MNINNKITRPPSCIDVNKKRQDKQEISGDKQELCWRLARVQKNMKQEFYDKNEQGFTIDIRKQIKTLNNYQVIGISLPRI